MHKFLPLVNKKLLNPQFEENFRCYIDPSTSKFIKYLPSVWLRLTCILYAKIDFRFLWYFKDPPPWIWKKSAWYEFAYKNERKFLKNTIILNWNSFYFPSHKSNTVHLESLKGFWFGEICFEANIWGFGIKKIQLKVRWVNQSQPERGF